MEGVVALLGVAGVVVVILANLTSVTGFVNDRGGGAPKHRAARGTPERRTVPTSPPARPLPPRRRRRAR
jgi:hypothetical protein